LNNSRKFGLELSFLRQEGQVFPCHDIDPSSQNCTIIGGAYGTSITSRKPTCCLQHNLSWQRQMSFFRRGWGPKDIPCCAELYHSL